MERKIQVDERSRRKRQRGTHLAQPHRAHVCLVCGRDRAQERHPLVAQDVQHREHEHKHRVETVLALRPDEPQQRRERYDEEHLVHERVRKLPERRDHPPPAREVPVEEIGQSRKTHQQQRRCRAPRASAALRQDGAGHEAEDQRHAREGQPVDEKRMEAQSHASAAASAFSSPTAAGAASLARLADILSSSATIFSPTDACC